MELRLPADRAADRRELLRNFPKGGKNRRRRKKKGGGGEKGGNEQNGKAEKSSRVHGTYGQSIRLLKIVQLIHRDHPPRAGLIDDEHRGLPRNVSFHMLRNQPRG